MAPPATISTPCRYCNYPADGEYLCDPKDPNICMPCQKLVELEQKVAEIRKMLVGLESQRRKLKEAVNYTHDSLLHRLPPEIASRIFVLCLPNNIMNINPKRSSKHIIGVPLILSAICTQWRAIAHSTPQLWTSIPLHLRISDSGCYPPAFLVQEWIDRSGQLPLSINLCVPCDSPATTWNATTVKIVKALNLCSNRWFQLKFSGSSLLRDLSSDTEDLPQLHTLCLVSYYRLGNREIPLHPKKLGALSIVSIVLADCCFDFDYLTSLTMKDTTLSDCFEALRRAPLLKHCTVELVLDDSLTILWQRGIPLPQSPVVHFEIQSFEIRSHQVHEKILAHVTCPSLKILILNVHIERLQPEPINMSLIIEFLRRSGCYLETLSLLNADISVSDISLLCQKIPTLQHLYVDFFASPSASAESLFANLAEFTTVDGMKDPRYLPALRSLSLTGVMLDNWTVLPDIFGAAGTGTNAGHYRRTLTSVKIVTQKRQGMLDLTTRSKILWLREAGVKWKIQNWKKQDMIQLAIDKGGISLM